MKKLSILLVVGMLLLSGCSGSDGAKGKSEKVNSDAGSKSTDIDNSSGQISEKPVEAVSTKGEIEFEDPMFERYIRSYLGKSAEDKLLMKELSELTELVIDRRFIETDFSTIKNELITLIRMDLSDLKYLPNLTRLEIQNDMNDIFYSLDAIGNLSKLEELSLSYELESGMQTYYYKMGYGYKVIDQILGKLPNLKKVEIGNMFADPYLADLQSAYPGIIITNDRQVQTMSTYKRIPGIITKVSELNELPKDTTMINMMLEDGENVNEAIGKAAALKGLTVLRVVTASEKSEFDLSPLRQHAALEELMIYGSEKYISSDKKGKIVNDQVLETIPNLRNLSLGTVSITDGALSTLKHLKALRLNAFEVDGFHFLSSCTELYQLDIMGGSYSGENVEESMKDFVRGMEKQNLQYLSTYMTGPILSYCPETVGRMTKLKDFTSIEVSVDDYFNSFDLTGCKELKRVVFSTTRDYEELDLSTLKGLDKLEYLWLDGSCAYTNKDSLVSLTNLQSFVIGISDLYMATDISLQQFEEFTQVLIKQPKLSMVSFLAIQSVAMRHGPEKKELVETNSKLLYEAGIYESYYGFQKLRGQLVEFD